MISRSALALFGAVLLLPQLAAATVIQGLSLEQLTHLSPVVVRGKVGAQQTRWDDAHRRIFTYTEIAVSERLKGKAADTILVRQPGGEVGPVGQHVEGVATFQAGEDVVLFLDPPPDERGVFTVVTLAAGKVVLAPSGTGEVRAHRDLRGIAVYAPDKDKAALKELNAEDLGAATQFLARVRKAASGGGAR